MIQNQSNLSYVTFGKFKEMVTY